MSSVSTLLISLKNFYFHADIHIIKWVGGYDMLKFLKKSPGGRKFDRKVLRKNDISLLILDERWNSLFVNTEKPPEILSLEEKLKDLLKEQARLITEAKEIAQKKKGCIDRIISLTSEAFDKNNDAAKHDMKENEKEIVRINERCVKIEEELDNIPDRIREINLELLEYTVNVVYFKIRADQRRVNDLEKLIEETRKKLMEYIDEKESLSEDYTGIYSYFHDLLGGEELEKLDREYFGS